MAADLLRLELKHPTAMAFVDESGSIARDRFFAVGCLKLKEPSELTRAVQSLRDRRHWYEEIHFARLNRDSAPFYLEVLNVLGDLRAEFTCFVADRERDDPVQRFGSEWKAYECLAEQLLIGATHRHELIAVLADSYSTPPHVVFERDLKKEVNRRLDRLAITSVCRIDSRAADPLQVADLLTSAVAFEFRQSAKLAGSKTPKAEVAWALRNGIGARTFLSGWRSIRTAKFRVNVAIYGASTAKRGRR